MVDAAAELRAEWLSGARVVGVTAGASAPEVLVKQVIERLRELGAVTVEELSGIAEKVVFPLPKPLMEQGERAPS
jgi:4-hydroxy-3-methylbut-2-enyl diphosphate reductase